MPRFRVKTSDGHSYIADANSQMVALRNAEGNHPKADRIEVYPVECEEGKGGEWTHLKEMSAPAFTRYEMLVSERRHA